MCETSFKNFTYLSQTSISETHISGKCISAPKNNLITAEDIIFFIEAYYKTPRRYFQTDEI